MTLTQRREVVRRFKAGETIVWLAFVYVCDQKGTVGRWQQVIIEQVLRDYMNGKFTLKAKRKPKTKGHVEYVRGCVTCEAIKRKARTT